MVKMKKSTCLSLLLALSLCMSVGQVYAQESVSKALLEAGNKSLSLGQYKEAEKKLRLALKEAETASAPTEELESILRQLVKVLEAQGQLSDAVSLQEKLIALDKSGKDTTKLLSDLSSLASNLKDKDEFKAAEEKYNEVLTLIDGKGLSKEINKDEAKVTLFLNMSGLYLEQSILDKAQISAKSALSLAEKMDAGVLKTKLQIECLDALGHIYLRQAGFDQAESCLQRALSLCNENASKKDKAHILLGLAQVKYDSGVDFDKSESLIKQCLELPDSDIAVQTEAMYLLVSILSVQNKNAEALKILEKCMAMQEKVYGKDSPNLAVCLRKQASLLIDMNDYNRAEMLINKAIAIDKKVGGSSSASDLSTLGMLYLRQGKYAEAEVPYKEALALAEQKKGESHPDVAACLNNLAWLYSNQNKFEEAQSLIERGLAIRQKALGENHPATARNIANLAKILIEQRKYHEAIPQLEKAYEIQKETLGAEHQDTINTLSELSEALFLSKQLPQAEENFRTLLEADKKLEGDKSSKVAWDMENLGKVLAAQDKTDQAKELIASAKVIKASLPGFIQNSGNPEESRGIFRQNTPGAQNIATRPVKDKWALVVGVSNFKDPSLNLQYAAKDATDFYNYLITEAHFAPDHVKLLLDKNATRENITTNLGEKWLGKVADKDDLVVVYLSSHGTSSHSDNNYIVAYETNLNNVIFTGISMQSFTTGINDILKSDRVVVVMDVCHGGAVRTNADMDNIARAKEEPTKIAIASADLNGMKGLIRSPEITGKNMGNIVGKGQIVLASSEADQVSWESTSYPNGVFTRRLIEGLRLNGEKTTVLEAFKHMRQKVEQEVLKDRSEIQTPIAVTNSWQGADIPLAIKVVSPRKPF